MQSSELLSRTTPRYDVPVTRMELLRRCSSGPRSGSNTAAKNQNQKPFIARNVYTNKELFLAEEHPQPPDVYRVW
ncbi:hypothetical protein EYF80_053091 [Liparis tanakae]|uniref:Uncharacterized protein n=1 Tax=Liparis tanakae TaxID=230148 RepID=A0A4Z2F6Q5_9TELE|nr:hypothetical protein EYF80_053091 [Liparis tanakae]